MGVQDIYDAMIEYDEDRVAELVEAELGTGTDPTNILEKGMVAAMDEVGRQFSEGILFVPEMLMAADAMKSGMEVLRPVLTKAGAQPEGTVVIGTVKGDLHDIGKNLVGMMLEGAGFQIVDLGTDVDAESFITTAQEKDADVIGMSGLLTTSMLEMEKAVVAVVDANKTRNLNVKVMIGGPPVSNEFAEKIGANGFGVDAPGAVTLARKFVKG